MYMLCCDEKMKKKASFRLDVRGKFVNGEETIDGGAHIERLGAVELKGQRKFCIIRVSITDRY